MSGPFSVICECGNRLPVGESDFGRRTKCECGLFLVVPLTEEFHVRTELVTATNVLRRVHILHESGVFPTTTACSSCDQEFTERVVGVRVVCEQSRQTGGGIPLGAGVASVLLTLLVLPVGGMLFLRPDEEPLEVFGRDTSITLPVRMCHVCHGELTNRSRTPLLALALGAVVSILVGVFVNVWLGVGVFLVVLLATRVVKTLALARRQKLLNACVSKEPAYRQLLGHYKFASIRLPRFRRDEG